MIDCGDDAAGGCAVQEKMQDFFLKMTMRRNREKEKQETGVVKRKNAEKLNAHEETAIVATKTNMEFSIGRYATSTGQVRQAGAFPLWAVQRLLLHVTFFVQAQWQALPARKCAHAHTFLLRSRAGARRKLT